MSDATLTEETPDVDSTPQVEAGAESAAEYDGPRCEKCGHPSNAAACPHCGWYPSLGIHVEIDEAFEAVMNGDVQASEEAAAPAEESAPDWQKHVEVWKDLIPMWGWLMIGTTLGAVGAGVAIRLATISSPTLQMYCGIGGLVGGALIALVVHLIAFLICSFEDADFGVADLIIKPFKTWKVILGELPQRLWLANTANAGVSVALSAALIVGGIPYEKLLDWGFKAKAKKNLVQMIAEKAGEHRGDGSDDLEGAIGDFVGQAGDPGAGGDGKPKAPEKLPRKPLECLIIGYQANKDGKVTNLLLAADSYGKLKYVGKVKPELEPDAARQFALRLAGSPSTRPLVKTPEAGSWVAPRFMCRVTYTLWEPGKRPKDLEWKELLEDMKLPW